MYASQTAYIVSIVYLVMCDWVSFRILIISHNVRVRTSDIPNNELRIH